MHTKLISVSSSVKVVILPIIKFFSSFADFGRTLCHIPVVTSRSLKWHLVPFRDFWSENSEKWSLFCLKSPFSNDLVPFSKIWVAKKQNWHFSHRYANYWFWFCWSVYLGIHFQLLCSFFGPFFEKLWSLFGPFFENLWSLFGPF